VLIHLLADTQADPRSCSILLVEAKLPRGDWLHPSIWLLPELEEYGMWPASGEIDLLSSRGNAPGYPGGGCDTMTSALHFGPNYNHDLGWGTQRAYALGVSFVAERVVAPLKWGICSTINLILPPFCHVNTGWN
jgi:hypothetical protein